MAIDPIIMRPSRERLLEQALSRLTDHIPSTKGMDPKTRAQRLHAELERRIKIANDALKPQISEEVAACPKCGVLVGLLGACMADECPCPLLGQADGD